MRSPGLFLFLLFISAKTEAQLNLDSGLVAYYPMSGSFRDASGKGNHGVGLNGATFGADHLGNPVSAAVFDGRDDYVSIPSSPALSPVKQMSLSFRFRTATKALQMLFSKSQFFDASGYQWQVGLNGSPNAIPDSLFYSTDHTGLCDAVHYGSDYTYGNLAVPNRWYCVVATFDSGTKKVYVNGSLINTTAISGVPFPNEIDSCVAGTVRMGVWWMGDPLWFNGSIDEVRLWDRALNSSEAAALCEYVPPPQPPRPCEDHLWLPNTFTPNNDDHNDTFYPRAKGGYEIRLFRIYNRWGELMVSRAQMPANDRSAGWDGSWNGVRLKPDTYVYVIDAICPGTGELVAVKGNVALIR